MKTIISIIFLIVSGLISIFFSFKQFSCDVASCGFNGLKVQKSKITEINQALLNSQEIEKKREAFSLKYNSILPEDRQKLEELVPNNVDNIKLVLEVETLANKQGLSITSPKIKLEDDQKQETSKATDSTGQAIRSNSTIDNSKYGSFVLDFNVVSNYRNLKALIYDMEKNLRLIDINAIKLSVPESIDPKTLKKSPDGVYNVELKTTIYYLKN